MYLVTDKFNFLIIAKFNDAKWKRCMIALVNIFESCNTKKKYNT